MPAETSAAGYSGVEKPRLSESRSIDYIPLRERHGHPFSQFTLWFGGNLQITAIVTGALAVVLGAMWSGHWWDYWSDRSWAQALCHYMRFRGRAWVYRK